jgi:hypothetical protein
MPKRITITANVYKDTIKNLKADKYEKRPYNYGRKTLVLYDNCRVHKA